MADANQEAAQLAVLLQQANKELAAFGEITQATADKKKDAEMKAKYGIDNFTASTSTAAAGLGELAKGAVSTFKAMADGKKGAAAFNEGVDHMTKATEMAAVALTLLIPGGALIKGLVAGVTAVTVAVIQAKGEFQKMSATMADKLYKSYSDLAKSGAAASTGMTGVLKLSNQLSLTMDELSDLTGIVAGNSQELALLGGSAAQGVQRLGDMGEAMKGSRKEFLAMGMSTVDIVEGQARYLKEMSRTGRAQNMTNKELAASATEYIFQQNRLAELTGMNAKQQQDVLDRAKSSEMFNSKIRELELQGTTESLAAADELKKGLIMAAAIGPGMEAGYKAMVTGNLRSADAQKLNFTTAGQAQKEIMGVANGTRKAADAFTGITKATARHEKTIGIAMSKLDAGSNVQLSSAEMEKAAILSKMSYADREQYIKDEEAKKRKTSNDALLKGQVDVVDRQIEANQEINKLVALGIPAAQKGMIDVAEASVKAAKALAKLAGVYKEEPTKPVANQMSSVGRDYKMDKDEQSAARDALKDPGVSEYDKAWLRQQLQNVEKREQGGPVDASVPYLVGEKGPELFVPSTGGQIVPMDMAGNVSEYTQRSAQNIKTSVEEILKDYKVQQKTIDSQTEKLTKFSRVEDQYFSKLTEFMNAVVTEVNSEGMPGVGQAFDQQSTGKTGLAGIMDIVNKMAGGNMSTANATQKSSPYSIGSPSTSNGTGLTSNSSPSAPGMNGGTGLKMPETHEAVGTGGGTGLKGPPKLTSVRSKTGKAAQVNTEYAPRFQGIIDYLDSVGYQIKSLGGFVDRDVRGKPGVKSVHAHGGAIDINPAENPMGGQLITDMPENISAMARQMGLGWGGNWASVKDAMHFSVAKHEGGDIKLSDGGVAVGPNGGYTATLHGEEAVIPLNNNGGNFVKLFENMADDSKQMLSMMQEMVRAQKDSVSVANKMLRMQN